MSKRSIHENYGVKFQFNDEILLAPWRAVKKRRSVLSSFIISLFFVSFLTACVAASTSGGIIADHERRTFGNFVDDQAISMRTSLAIAKDRELWRKGHISILSYNKNLLLVGQTPTLALKEKAAEIAHNTPDVEKVYNEIAIRKPISFTRRAQDGWITTQVKTKLMATHDIGPNRVKVITENGIVFLLGILTTDEAYIATEIARNVKGVREVKTIFESLT